MSPLLLRHQIAKIVQNALQKNFPEFVNVGRIEYPGDSQHGDYAANAAFEVAKALKKSPRAVAEELFSSLALPSWIAKTEIAGPGFINFFLAPEFLTEYADEVCAAGGAFGTSEIGRGKTIVTDSSHPNIAKPMGVHHLLSTIIGNALNRIFEAVGYRVIRDNYLGDWGTQYGKLMYAYKQWGVESAVKKNPIPELLKLYVKFHDEAEHDATLEERGRAEFKKLEDGDPENRKLWQWMVDVSIREFQKMYDRLDVRFDCIHGESFYEDKMKTMVDLGMAKGIFVEGEGGALIAKLDHLKLPPCLIKKSDGATLYATRDLARTQYWEDTWHPDLMIMVVDSAQSLHFQQFFEVARMLDITKAPNVHVSFGRMRFPEKRMSTRKGNVILLDDVLDEAEERAYKIVCEKNPHLPEQKKRKVARMVGIGSVKYAVLAQNRNTDIVFTWEKILSLEGNSAPYVQYAHARAQAMLKKADQKYLAGAGEALQKPEELAVARLLPKFPEVVEMAAAEFKPNLVANYLFELASRFNSFYAALPVLQAAPPIRRTRLILTQAAAQVIKNGLALLGIEAPEEM